MKVIIQLINSSNLVLIYDVIVATIYNILQDPPSVTCNSVPLSKTRFFFPYVFYFLNSM